MPEITAQEGEQIAKILTDRAHEIAMFKADPNRTNGLSSVEYALDLEVKRLRRLASRVAPGTEFYGG